VKIVSIVGARPEFVQASPVSHALAGRHDEVLVHTGQHYDYAMSQAFFDELDIPQPHYNLGVGSGSHARQTGEIMARLEDVLLQERPDLVIVRGDTNSTLAGALVASKLRIPLAHIEAGERSYCRDMPEEINRVMCDAVADLHFCTSETSVSHLAAEGIVQSVYRVGDVMLDALLKCAPVARERSGILRRLGLSPEGYALVTVHRAANTDCPQRLQAILQALNRVGERVIFPAHPRTRQALARVHLPLGRNLQLIEPVGYLDMLALEAGARLIATDSGGVQREAYYLSKPCLTLREETEWAETVATGWNRLVGADPEAIVGEWHTFAPPQEHPPIYGNGNAAEQIVHVLDGMSQAFEDRMRVRGRLRAGRPATTVGAGT